MGTLWIEFTKWRGLLIDHTLFGPVVRIGFVGLGVSKFVLTAWIETWRSTIRKVAG